MQYTWGLLLLTLKQVEEELGVKGNLAAMWDLVQVEEGGEGGEDLGERELEEGFGGGGVWRGIWGRGGGVRGKMDVLSS